MLLYSTPCIKKMEGGLRKQSNVHAKNTRTKPANYCRMAFLVAAHLDNLWAEHDNNFKHRLDVRTVQ